MLSNHKNSYIIFRPPMYYVVYQPNFIHEECCSEWLSDLPKLTWPGGSRARIQSHVHCHITSAMGPLAENKSHVSTNEDQTIRSVCNKGGGVGRVGLTPRTRLCNSHEQNINVYLLLCLGNCTIWKSHYQKHIHWESNYTQHYRKEL